MALTPGFQLPFGIQPLNPVPTDSWSGPYEGVNVSAAIAAANAAIPPGVRFKSLEVRLIINGSAAKYWYRDGVTDSDLVEFSGLPSAATFTTSVSAPALSGTFYGDGSKLTGISGGGGTANALPLSGGTLTGPLTGTIATFTVSVSAPTLSGAFSGDGSGLTGLYARVKELDMTTLSAYVLTNTDINYFLTINNGTNNTLIALSQEFHNATQVGTQVVLLQTGTGTVTISSTYVSASIISSYNRYKIVGQNSAAALVKVSNSTWFLGGDIAV